MSAETHHKIEKLVARLARRIRMQRATEGFITGATLTAMVAMLALVLFKTGWIEEQTLFATCGAALLAPLTLAFVGWLRPLDRIALAQRLDRSHDLHDRLSTALSLGERGAANRFEEAQISEAADHVGRVDPALAAPLRRPTDLVPFAALAACLAALAVLKPPSHTHEIPQPPEIQHEQVLDSATIAMERDRLEAIRRELQGVDDPEAVQLLEEIEQLLNEVENQEISEREFLDRLNKLEEKFFDEEKDEMSADEAERVAEELKKAAEELEKELKKEIEQEPAAQELVDAMKKKDLARASKAMEKIAEMLANKDLDEKKLERLAKIMEKLAKNINFEDPALQKLMEKNKDLIDKLSKKFDKLSDKDKNRLNRAKEELEKQQAEQKKNEERESTRQLKKLRRLSQKASEDAKKAAKGGNKKTDKEIVDEERHKFKQEAGRAAKEASEEMEQGGEEQQKQSARDAARKQLREMKEAMQRSKTGQGKKGQQKDGEKGEQMKEFLERAKGQSKTKAEVEQKVPGEGKEGSGERGHDHHGGDGKADKDTGGTDSEAEDESNFAGRGKGSRELGDETDLDSKRVDEKVDVDAAGKGPSRSEIIKSASEEGFATTEYKDVYVDYSSVVEEVMDKEKIPAGYRFYVKRYFQLIKPQE